MKNRYILLMGRILRLLLKRKLLGWRKLSNAIRCYAAYALRMQTSGASPIAVNFELDNECNANCVFCRTEAGEIYNNNPERDGYMEKGEMPFDLYCRVIDEVKGRLVMAILYVNGEPFMYRRLFDAVRYASDRNVATMISTNGIALTEDNARRLLDDGICFVKVAVSGFTEGTYRRQARRGDIARIRENIVRLQRFNAEKKTGAILMLDFMIYDYNAHEVEEARRFCRDLGVLFNVRPGNPRNIEVSYDYLEKARPKAAGTCDWPWKILAINWNGDVFPCCDYVVWKDAAPVKRITAEDVGIPELWNGEGYRRIRSAHSRVGRKAIDVCRGCTRSGIAFRD